MTKFTIPKERYLVEATFQGKTYSVTVNQGETATPYFDPIKKTVTWKITKEQE